MEIFYFYQFQSNIKITFALIIYKLILFIFVLYKYFRVTKEHREQLAKNARAIFIQHRDEMKEVRNKAIKMIKKQDISEDLSRRAQTNVDALFHKYVKEAEKILIDKQNELTGSTN